MISQFSCPESRGKLRIQNDSYLCEGCNSMWQSHDGIPSFSKLHYYWNQVPLEKMDEAIDVAKKSGWKQASTQILAPIFGSYNLNYSMNETRADWRFLVPVTKNAKVLDLGCGWGAVTIALARYYRSVIGADATLQTLQFLKVRANQENIPNLKFVHVDPLDYGRLPFSDSSFDLVVLNGVLEWVGKGRDDISPDLCQKIALREINRVLKPNAVIYVGIENRFHYRNFLGASGHNGIAFTDILPRKLANWLCKAKGMKEGFRSYTHSYYGYKKLLAECGFTNIRMLLPFPSYRKPKIIVDCEDERMIKFYVKNFFGSGVSERVARFLVSHVPFLMKYFFTYSYGIIGGK